MNTKKIAIASDHAGFELKRVLVQELQSLGYAVLDLGPATADRCDYPIQAQAVARSILAQQSEQGVLICGSGIGMSIAANRFVGIRAALAHNVYTAQMSKQHNDAQILCLGARIIDESLAKEMLKVFLSTEFEGQRHALRIAQIDQIDEKND